MPRSGGARPGAGRPKGSPNKVTTLLKDAILQAATLAGGKDGLVGYLRKQAQYNPGPFMALMGKVLPLQVTGPNNGPIEYRDVTDAKDRLEHFITRVADAAAAERSPPTIN